VSLSAERVGQSITLNLNSEITVSYSSLSLLTACPRKFSLYKIYPDGEFRRDTSPALSQGSAVGVGYARWLELQVEQLTNPSEVHLSRPSILEEAMLESWRAYYPPLEDNVRSMTKAAILVQRLAEATEESMEGWQLASINGKPCTETSFCIKLGDAVLRDDGSVEIPATYFVGFLDAILENVITGQLLPLELKTTTLTQHIRENFLNSSQGNGYGLVLDTIQTLRGEPAGMQYSIQYLVAQAHKAKAEQFNPTIHAFKYTKTIFDRLEWLMDLKLTHQKLLAFLGVHMFPRNGGNCLAWNRLCNYSGICNLTQTARPRWEQLADAKPDLATYDFYFDISELITDAVALTRRL